MTDKHIRIILDSKQAETSAKKLDKNVTDVGKSADKTVFAVNKLAAAIAAAFAAERVARFFTSSIAAAGKFQSSISDLAAITGATGEDLQFLSDAAREFGATTTLSATQAAEAIKLIASAKPDLLGNAQALKEVTKEAIALAEAAGSDLPQAASILGGSLNQFNLEATESARVINVLAAGAKFGSSELEDTSLALKNAGVSAAAANISFEETNAAIQVLAANTVKGAEAGTGLRNVITILNTSTDKKLRPSIVGLSGALDELASRQLDNTEMVKLFGRENISAGQILIRNVGRLKELEGQLTNTSVAYDQQRIRTDNLQGDIKQLGSAYEELQISVGELFTGKARDSVQNLTKASTFLAENLEQIVDVVEILSVAVGTRLAVAASTSAFAFTRNQIAIARAAGTMNVASIAARALSVSMGLLGGPLGVIAIAAAAFLTYKKQANEAADATTVLAESTDNLTRAQADNLNLKTQDSLNAELDKIESLNAELNKLTELYKNYGKRGGQASRNNAKDQARVADQIERTKVELGLATENADKLGGRLERLKTVINDFSVDQDPFGFGSSDPFAVSSASQPSGGDSGVDSSANLAADNTAIQSAKSTTAALQRELDLRRGISQIYRQNELDATAGQFEKEQALNAINWQTRLAEEEARYADDLARRKERLDASLENDALEEGQKIVLRQEFADQKAIAEKLSQERITAINAEGARARDDIAKKEMQSRLSNAQALGGALISLGQGQSKKIFKIGKTLALAQAAAALPSAVIQSFQNGGGYPWGLVPAGAMLATGLKNINDIRSAGSGLGGGGGGSVPSISLPSGGGGGGAPTPQTSATGTASSVEAPQRPTTTTVIFESNSLFTGEQINEKLKEFSINGGNVVGAPG